MRYHIIANPHSGRGRGRKALPLVRERLAELGLPYACSETTGPGMAGRLAAEAVKAGAEVLVVLGGDGTLHEVLNGVMSLERRPKIAQVPVGTGNSFIKDLGMNSLEDGLAALASGSSRRVDVGKGRGSAGDFWFINLTGVGFVARIARRAIAFKFLGGFAYTIATLLELPFLRAKPLTIVADGVTSVRDAIFVEVCNSTKTGGDMIMAPGALVDDGLFEVIVAKKMGRLEVLRLFPTIFAGTHVRDPKIEAFACKSIEVGFDGPEPATPDGELFGNCPLSMEVLPGAIEILVP